MAQPIELIKGGQRVTVYNETKADALVADGWQRVRDLTPAQQAELAGRPALPWKNYESQTAAEVLALAQGLPPEQIAAVVRYESATKGRVSIVNRLTGRPAEQGTQAAPIPAASAEQQLEAETGKDFVQTGTTPPTFVETSAPAKGGR